MLRKDTGVIHIQGHFLVVKSPSGLQGEVGGSPVGRLVAAVAPLARHGGSGQASRCLTCAFAQGPRCRSGLSTVTALKVFVVLSL